MTRPDNPRVYPSQISTQWFHEGMTFWDEFAGQVISRTSVYLSPLDAARVAAEAADALLVQRQKRIDAGELAVSREGVK